MTSNQAAERKLRTFSNAFFNAIHSAMTEACGSAWHSVEQDATGWTEEESEPVWISLSLAGNLRGDLTLEFYRSDAALLASKLLQQPVGTFGDEQSEALLGLINAAGNQFSTGLTEEYANFSVAPAAIVGQPDKQPNTMESTMGDEEGTRVTMRMYIDAALSESLFLHSQVENAVASSTKSATTASAAPAKAEAINLGLVMDVELNVTLRFGQRQLTLREVLDLTTGSVVELDRQVEEPVELLLDGAVIARGEAVVIDGNYGLRVTEVTKPVSSATID